MNAIRAAVGALAIALVAGCGGGGGGGGTGGGPGGGSSLATYVHPSNPAVAGQFGYATAMSQDGSTMVVAAWGEDGAGSGINGDQGPGAEDSGAVYVFVRGSDGWVQQAYIKASNAGSRDAFGESVALSADGNTLAVGAPQEDGADTGVNGSQADGITDSGAVYVFTRAGDAWSQQAYIKASNTGQGDHFGEAVALSGDGRTLAVGAPRERSPATTVDGDQGDDAAALLSGAAYVFAWNGATWSQQAYVKGSRSSQLDLFGTSVALSFDGNTLSVGAYGERGTEELAQSGSAYIFQRANGAWVEQEVLRADIPAAQAFFGARLCLSADGNTLAVGAAGDSGNAKGVNGPRDPDPLGDSGAAYVFVRNGAEWTQQAYVKASNPGQGDYFGFSVALSADGTTLAVGAIREDSTATGLNGDQQDNAGEDVGAAYVFRRGGSVWSQTAYVKPIDKPLPKKFGGSVALSGDGRLLAAGATLDSAGGDSGSVHIHTMPTQ